MARRNTVVRDVTLNQSGSIVFTDAERKSEFLKVAIRITNRPDQVGTFNLEPTIPRKWSGWFWVIHKNNVVESGAIQFENQLLLRSQLVWIFEQAVNTYSIEATTPDSDANELIDENAVLNYYSDETDPDNYYLPFPHPYDEIKLWFPSGVTTNVIIEHTPWSPISVFGEDNDLEVAQFIQEREELTQPSLGTNTALPLDDVCATAFPDNWTPDPPQVRSVQWNVNQNGQFFTSRYILWQTDNPIGLVGVPVNGTTTITLNPAIPAYSGNVDCSAALSTSRSQTLSGVRWSYQQIEIDGVAHFVYQTVPTSAPSSTTIDASSFTFGVC